MAGEKIVWGVHMQNVRDDAPIRHGYIGIGWHEVGDLSQFPANRQAFKSAYTAAMPAQSLALSQLPQVNCFAPSLA